MPRPDRGISCPTIAASCEFRMEARRCQNAVSAAVKPLSSVRKLLVRPSAPRLTASAPANVNGSEPSCNPIPITGLISARLSGRGHSVIGTTGATAAMPKPNTRSATTSRREDRGLEAETTLLQRWTCAICRPACIASRRTNRSLVKTKTC